MGLAGNNRQAYRLRRLADPGWQTQGFPPTLLTATLLNASGVDNVRLNASLFNFATGAQGSIPAGPVTVRLLRSIDDGDWIEIGTQSFDTVLPGGFGTPIEFFASGLAGDNRYRLVVDPRSLEDDSNLFNNVAEASLQIRGLANLTLAQTVKLAASNQMLCRFRFDDHALLSTLTHTAKSHDMQQIHAAILLARQPVESLN